MAVIFNDTFTETLDTTLANHLPNTGLSWTQIITIASDLAINATTDQLDAAPATGSISDGALYTADTLTAYPTANYKVKATYVSGLAADDPIQLAARIQDANNMYVVQITLTNGQIYKRVAGTFTALGTTFATPAAGSVLIFEVDGSNISVYDDGVQVKTVSDTAITAVGKAGVGMGQIGIGSGNDMNNQIIDDFSVDTIVPIAITQAAYRLYEDGTETASTAIAAQDTNITRDVTANSNLQLRVRLQETNATAGLTTDDYQLQYEKNGGSYYDVGVGASTGFATPTRVQDNSATNAAGGSQAVTLLAAPTSGNLLVGIVRRIGTTNVGTLDGGGWTLILSSTFTTNSSFDIYYKIAGASESSTITGTATSSTRITVTIMEYSGIANVSPVDKTATGSATASTTVNTGTTATTTQANELLIGIAGCETGGATSEVWSDSFLHLTRADNRLYVADRVVTSTGAYTTTHTYGASVTSSSAIITFKAAETFAAFPVANYASASLTDGGATTNRLGAGTGAFVAGEVSETGLVTDHQITASNYTEHLYSLTLVASALANNDTLDFRVLRNGAVTGLTYTTTPGITVSQTGGAVTVTPSTASLTTATFAPTVTASNNQSVAPTTASLVTNSFAPAVTVSDNQSVTPATATLTTTTYVPTVTVQVNTVVTPATASLVTTTFIPTVTASNNQSVTPATATLTTSTFAPTVTASAHQTVTPNTATLTLTSQTPTVTVANNQSVVVGTASLTTATFAPSVALSNNQFATPATTNLVSARFAPTVTTNTTVTPNTATITTTRFAPIVFASDNKSATPGTNSLTTSLFAPTVLGSDNKSVTISTASLITTRFAPVVSFTANQVVTPGTTSLTISLQSPTVTTGNNQAITPATAILTTAIFAPTVTTTANQLTVPNTASLTINSYVPTVTASSSQVVTPTTANLTLTTQSVTVAVGDNKSATPATASLSLVTFAPTVSLTNNKLVTPATASLTISRQLPTVTVNNIITPLVAEMITSMFAPNISVLPSNTRTIGITGTKRSVITLSGFGRAVNLEGKRRAVSTSGSKRNVSVTGNKKGTISL